MGGLATGVRPTIPWLCAPHVHHFFRATARGESHRRALLAAGGDSERPTLVER